METAGANQEIQGHVGESRRKSGNKRTAGANQVIQEHVGESRSKSGNKGTCWREQEQIR